jgi:hypothetical protein
MKLRVSDLNKIVGGNALRVNAYCPGIVHSPIAGKCPTPDGFLYAGWWGER